MVGDPLDALSTGMRVVVRHRVDGGLTDVLGELVALDADVAVVVTRRGTRSVARGTVVAAKQVPPAPARRGAPHRSVSTADLERLAVAGWPPVESSWLGGWLLRASGGYTGRANSVLPLGDPGMPLAAAVDEAAGWQRSRGLRPMFCVFGPPGFSVAEDGLGAELLARGYAPAGGALVMTGSLDRLAAVPAPDVVVAVSSRLTSLWLQAYAAQRPGDQAVLRAVLAGSPEQLFLSVEQDGRPVAVARVAFAHAWAGLSAVHVVPQQRRLGLAVALMAAAARESRARGIRSAYLQVAPGNHAAMGLYRRLAFAVHHEYVYLALPG